LDKDKKEKGIPGTRKKDEKGKKNPTRILTRKTRMSPTTDCREGIVRAATVG